MITDQSEVTEGSRIFTSETQVARALAAEIRHDPDPFIGFLSHQIGRPLAAMRGLKLEVIAADGVATRPVDIVLRLSDGRTVGLELKFAHFLTQEQVDAEHPQVDELFVVVLESIDAAEVVLDAAHVVTWADMLRVWPTSRIHPVDIAALAADAKLDARRIFSRLAQRLRGEDAGMAWPGAKAWAVAGEPTSTGRPSLTLVSDRLSFPDGFHLVAQVEQADRESADRFVATVGLHISPTLWSELAAESPTAKSLRWANALLQVQERLIEAGQRFEVKWAPRVAGATALKTHAVMDVLGEVGVERRFMKGYTESYIGAKTTVVDRAELDEFCTGLMKVLGTVVSSPV